MNIKSGKISRGLSKSACYQLGLLLVLAFAFPHQLFGQCSKSNAFNCVYTTDGAGGDILAVDRTSGAVTKITSVKGTLNDIRVASDNRLYVTSNNSVLRLNGSGKVTQIFGATKAIPGPFTGIRFTPLGDAYINTPAGVYQIGPDANGNHLIQITGPAFPTPVQVTDAACSISAGGLAVWPTGDLLIGCNTKMSGNGVYEVLRCPAVNGVASGCTGQGSAIQQMLTTSSPVTGVAVDASANIIVASGSTVTAYSCTVVSCSPTGTTLATFTGDIPSYIDTAPFPPGLTPSQAAISPAICDSGAVTTYVSTGDASGQNGKLWQINTVKPDCSSSLTQTTLALVSSNKLATGVGVASASRTLTKVFPDPVSNEPSRLFGYGPFTIQITNTTVNTGCGLQLTAQREPLAALNVILAQAHDQNGNLVPSKAIPFFGEQGWATSFHGGFDASGCTIDKTVDSHIGITGALQYVNPWIMLIDDGTGKATLDPIPSVFPGFSLNNVPGDPIKIINGGLFTNDARIVLVDRGFLVNNAQGYQFQGFLSPLVDTGQFSEYLQNVENAGKSFVLKFNLLVNGVPISDTQGFAVTTGLSVARLTCDPSAGACQGDQEMLINPEGNSATPPSFNYVGGGQFHFNLDTNQSDGTEWCNGIYEATANSDSFSPHTIWFEIVGAPASPACF